MSNLEKAVVIMNYFVMTLCLPDFVHLYVSITIHIIFTTINLTLLCYGFGQKRKNHFKYQEATDRNI